MMVGFAVKVGGDIDEHRWFIDVDDVDGDTDGVGVDTASPSTAVTVTV